MADFEERLKRFFYDPDEDVSALVDLGEAAGGARERVEVPEEFLIFLLATERFLVPLAGVREVVKVPLLTEIPRASGGLLGLMNLRGELLPVYDAACRLGLFELARDLASPDAPPPPRTARVVVLYAAMGDAGLLVDRVLGVVRLPPSSFSVPGPGVLASGQTAVVALGHHEGALHCLLDSQELLA